MASDPAPKSLVTDLWSAAVAAHEVFSSFKAAGFTPAEALELTKAVITDKDN
jgi:hypothetical protein